MERISVNLLITDIKKHQADFSDLFDDIREVTSEEKDSVNDYMKSTSEPIGIKFYNTKK